MSTYTYAELEITPEAFQGVLERIREAGPEYVERYYSRADGKQVIHFTGAEVALVATEET